MSHISIFSRDDPENIQVLLGTCCIILVYLPKSAVGGMSMPDFGVHVVCFVVCFFLRF